MTSPVFLGLVQSGRLHLDFPAQYRAFIQRFEGDEVEIEVRKRRTKRSLRQNSALWALLTEWARAESYDINDLKDDVMGEAFGWSDTASPLKGRVVPVRNRTSELSVEDFCHLIETILEKAAFCGVVLMAPDEYRKAKEAAAKRAARKKAA